MDTDKGQFRPTFRTQADVENAWRFLMRPLGFSRRSLWMMFVEPTGQAHPQLTEFTDLHELPRPDDVELFADVLAGATDDLAPRPRIAFLLSRPGRDGVQTPDRVWAALLYDAARRADLACETVHLANDQRLLPLPTDELGAA